MISEWLGLYPHSCFIPRLLNLLEKLFPDSEKVINKQEILAWNSTNNKLIFIRANTVVKTVHCTFWVKNYK